MKKFLEKNMKNIGSIAIEVAKISADSTSLWYNYQPKVPNKLKKNNK